MQGINICSIIPMRIESNNERNTMLYWSYVKMGSLKEKRIIINHSHNNLFRFSRNSNQKINFYFLAGLYLSNLIFFLCFPF